MVSVIYGSTPSSSKERCSSAGSRYTRKAPAWLNSASPYPPLRSVQCSTCLPAGRPAGPRPHLRPRSIGLPQIPFAAGMPGRDQARVWHRKTSPGSMAGVSRRSRRTASEALISGRSPEVAIPNRIPVDWRNQIGYRRRPAGDGAQAGVVRRVRRGDAAELALLRGGKFSRPSSRATARVKSPPLIPIRRWMRQPSIAIPASSSAFCQANIWAYTVSTSVPSRSKMSA